MIRVRFFVAMFFAMFALAVKAGDMDAMIEDCNACHGDDGVSQWDDMPTIAGISQFSHAEALYLYRDRERACVDSDYRQGDTSKAPTNMCDIVAGMDDDTIEAIADHYSALPWVSAVQDFDADLAAAGQAIHEDECDRCHSDGGANPEDDASILAGQWMGYMRVSFKQYAAGERWQDDKMAETMEDLSDEDVEALVHYYASQQ